MLMEFYYEVKSAGGRTLHVFAENSYKAKRKACRIWGFSPNDPWVGISSMKAKKIAPEAGGAKERLA